MMKKILGSLMLGLVLCGAAWAAEADALAGLLAKAENTAEWQNKFFKTFVESDLLVMPADVQDGERYKFYQEMQSGKPTVYAYTSKEQINPSFESSKRPFKVMSGQNFLTAVNGDAVIWVNPDFGHTLQIPPEQQAQILEAYVVARRAKFDGTPPEKVTPKFDGGKWVSLGDSARAGEVTEDFVPEGGTAADWKEKVTTQFFSYPAPTTPADLDAFKKDALSQMAKMCPGSELQTLSSTPDAVSLYFGFNACPGMLEQSELVRLVRTEHGIHLFSYTVKQAPMPADKRTEWAARLREFKIE